MEAFVYTIFFWIYSSMVRVTVTYGVQLGPINRYHVEYQSKTKLTDLPLCDH